MNNITYLFGAGASKNALPIVDEIPERLSILIQILESKELKLESNEKIGVNLVEEKSISYYFQEMISSFNWLLEKSKNHASVDTFAKKLFLKRDFEQLKRLKIALSVFFTLEQVRMKPDFRYDAFFASLLSSLFNFPENIRILTWNYDLQFEIAFSDFSDDDAISNVQNTLNVSTKNYHNDFYEKFGIIKLNGTTGLMSDRGLNTRLISNYFNVPFDRNFVIEVTKKYAEAIEFVNFIPSLSFSWEKDQNNFIENTVQHLSKTQVLVVIGYSFPFFNRDIDRKIIGGMENLKKVYFQAPDAQNLKERFLALKDDLDDVELVLKKDVKQFLLPNEL